MDYELNKMAFHPKDLKSDSHRARRPLGWIPALGANPPEGMAKRAEEVIGQ